MRKVILIFFVACFAIFSVDTVFAVAKNVFKGTWEYNVPDAPYEYSTGKIVFADSENGQQIISIRFTNGTEIKAKEVKIDNDTFSFTTVVESYNIKVTGKLAEGKVSGKVDTPQGIMNLTAVQKH